MEIVTTKPGQWSTSDGIDHADYASAAAWCDYCNANLSVAAINAEHGIKPLQSVNSWLRFNHVNDVVTKANNMATKHKLWRANHA